jgi:beta-fructofuranosidase
MSNTLRGLTRRNILQGLVAVGASAAAPRLLLAEFPPQSVIDNDPLRPRYHLMPQRGWMNDPCAPVFFDKRYHLFFQYNPDASVWGDMHWAHAVSPDMVHWSSRPVALAPSPGGPDSFGVFTGSMVFDKSTPTILYTCVSPSSLAEATLSNSNPPEREAQCLAAPVSPENKNPDAALDTWQKLPKPVIPAPPDGMKVTGFRDPVPWKGGDGNFYMLLASGEKGKGGDVLLYKSTDLRSWQFQHVFAQGRPNGKQTPDTVDSGEMWECPDFFPLGDKHVLIHSTGTADGRKTFWQSGSLDTKTMQWTPEHEGLLNHGPYYAPKTQLDAAGNRILWGWIPEDRPEAEFAKAGWAGCMSLPRVLTLDHGIVRFTPAPEVISLRAPAKGIDASSLNQGEFLLRLERASAPSATKPLHFTSAALVVDSAVDSAEDPASGKLLWNSEEIPLDAPLPESFEIRCFVDHSVVEVFLGNRLVLTHRVYGTTPASLRLPAHFRATSKSSYQLNSI